MTALHTTITGPEDAPTIVLLHGLGLSGWMWSDQVDSLSRSYRCITIDLPGNGLSHGTEWTSFADSADAVAEVIRAEGGTAHVVGLSLGGYTALFFARTSPRRFGSRRCLRCICPTHDPATPVAIADPGAVGVGPKPHRRGRDVSDHAAPGRGR